MTDTSATTTGQAPPAGTYRIDPQRSTIDISTRHLFGLAAVHGSFTLLDGDIRITDSPGESTSRATIDAASFTTNNAKRDADVKSPKLLDVANHPTISFAGSQLQLDGQTFHHPGTLTAHGVSRPVA